MRSKRANAGGGYLLIETHRDGDGNVIIMHQRRVAGDGSLMWSVTDDRDNLSTRVWCRDDQLVRHGFEKKFEDFDWELDGV
jgi:hypothetical protein